MDDEATKLRCVIAFANLSCEYTIQGKMVSGEKFSAESINERPGFSEGLRLLLMTILHLEYCGSFNGIRHRGTRWSIFFLKIPCYYCDSFQVKAGVVRVLSELSISYKEKNQLYCAKAFCNLACHHGSEKALIEEGGVSALMMIALVRQLFRLSFASVCAPT